jgi:hypothetical protein
VALNIVRRPKATPVHEPERYMRCKDCSQVRGYPYKRSHLVALRHAPVIVCDDVDPVTAAEASVAGKSRNPGQVCVSPTRFFVQESIYQRFADSFAEKAAQVKVGDGLDPKMQMGPLANSRRIDAMEALVADAKSKGARVLVGGSRIGNRGYFFPLTVLADVPDDARAMNEESRWHWSIPFAIWMRRSRRQIRCLTAWPLMPSHARQTTPIVWPTMSKPEISQSTISSRR